MRIIRYQDLDALKGIRWSRVHVARLEKDGRFPMHIDVGDATVGWIESEVDAWIADRIAARDAKPEPPPAAEVA